MTTPTQPIPLLVHGADGRMGRAVIELALRGSDVEILGLLDLRGPGRSETPGDHSQFDRVPDRHEGAVIVDFSRKEAVLPLLRAMAGTGARMVCGTTGLATAQREALKEYSEESPVFYDENMSYGISVLKRLLALAGPLLKDASDVEIVETHHRHKLDYPSGTALALARLIDPEAGVTSGRGDRSGIEAGVHVHSIRLGGVPGEHQVVFATDREVVTLGHRALSREVFAEGALRAAGFVAAKKKGLYSMEDLVRGADD